MKLVKIKPEGEIYHSSLKSLNKDIEIGGKRLDNWLLDEPHLNQLSSNLYIFFFLFKLKLQIF